MTKQHGHQSGRWITILMVTQTSHLSIGTRNTLLLCSQPFCPLPRLPILVDVRKNSFCALITPCQHIFHSTCPCFLFICLIFYFKPSSWYLYPFSASWSFNKANYSQLQNGKTSTFCLLRASTGAYNCPCCGQLAAKICLPQMVHWSMKIHLLKNKEAFNNPGFHLPFLTFCPYFAKIAPMEMFSLCLNPPLPGN